ncbi:MAG: tight adherence protein [Actinomycetota bacterium]|jgi:tight adherence protein B
MTALLAGARTALVVVVLSGLTFFAAARTGSARRRAAVIGRVSGELPPRDPRRVRSLGFAALREPPRRLVSELATLDVGLDAVRVWRAWRWATLCAALGGALLIGVVFGVLLAVLVGGSPLAIALVLRSRADAAYDDTLAAALDAAARSVRSGGSLPQAVTEASTSVRGPVARDLTRVATTVARGRPFADALDGWRGARQRPAVRLAVGALVLATQTGGPPARVIEDVASALRSRQQVAREAHALAAQARLSAIVVGVAPLAFMLVTCATDARNAHMLFGTPIGVACVVTGLLLDALGAFWMHRMSATVAA